MSNTFGVEEIKTMAERLLTREMVVGDVLCRLQQDVPLWAELALIRSSEEILEEVYDEAVKQGYGDLVEELLGTEFMTSNVRLTHNSPFSEDESFNIFMTCTFHVNKKAGTYKIYVYNSDTLSIKTYDSYDEWKNDPDNGVAEIGYADLPLAFHKVPECIDELLKS